MRLAHWNPGAEKPLVLPVHLICNTSDEALYENIEKNSRLRKTWQKLCQAHDRVAILCGSGPSLADTLGDIRQKKEEGGIIFAMNGAASFLYENGITADYQVIIDAREETASLIGPARAHLFASQVHPVCFEKCPDAFIWHLQIESIEDHFPEYDDDYCLIGGAASVGNTATCLAYSMGYRNLQIYGYDSSHRDGSGHAFHQKMNEGDPCASVYFNGKDYIASLTMKLQAEKFQVTAKALKELGVHIEVHGAGLLPDIYNAPPMTEEQKYRSMWALKEYRYVSPGEHIAPLFVEMSGITQSDSCIDFGAGTGRGGNRVVQLSGCDMTLADFAENCLDADQKLTDRFRFVKVDLTKPMELRADYGFCCDVMEHIPPDDVDNVIKNITDCVDKVFFQISLIPDVCGEMIGEELHLSVHPYEWWINKLNEFGEITHSIDHGDSAVYYLTTQKVNNDCK